MEKMSYGIFILYVASYGEQEIFSWTSVTVEAVEKLDKNMQVSYIRKLK